MTISKEAVEAAEGVWSIGNRFGPDAGRKHDIAEYLESLFLALRPAPSQSDEGPGSVTQRIFDAFANLPGPTPMKAIREALATVRAEATIAGAAAEREAWNKPNIDAIREAKDEDLRTLRAAKDRENAALREELGQTKALALAHFTTGCSPSPDPAEAMRAKCEDCPPVGYPDTARCLPCPRRAALKGNGEGQ